MRERKRDGRKRERAMTEHTMSCTLYGVTDIILCICMFHDVNVELAFL